MCIAIYKPANEIIPEENLRQCFLSNPDGAGYMFNEAGKLHMFKGFFNFESFYEHYKENENKQCVIHFRIKTHGLISQENCHPFIITSNVGFIHNGIIQGYGEKDKSDTFEFNEVILKPIVKQFGKAALWKPYIKTLIESKIGYSKLVFLDSRGNYNIYNELKGSWDSGVWYSNNSYKLPKPKPVVKHPYEDDNDFYTSRGYWSKRHYPTQYPVTKQIITKPMPDDGPNSYYLNKSNGYHIYNGDWAEVTSACEGHPVLQGDWVEVVNIGSTGLCQVKTVDDKIVERFPGAFLALDSYGYYPDITGV